MNEIITIQISNYLTDPLAKNAAQSRWGSSLPTYTNRVRQLLFDELADGNDTFEVVALSLEKNVVGSLHCVKNKADPRLWYYGDLFVIPAYRRRGIAKQMLHAAISHLSELGAERLRCYVELSNTPSHRLQASVGFTEKAYAPFHDLETDGQQMYETDIPKVLTVIPATSQEAYFVRILFVQNKSAFNTANISLGQWRELLATADPDRKHFLICKGAVPVAYMQIHGSPSQKTGQISMLFVAPRFQRQGIGSFAIRYAEEFFKEQGFASITLPTNGASLPIKRCCFKHGYQPDEQNTETVFWKAL
ncbi:MAG: GNAT family N-acetyltransferase [Clostridia bacterium]|nr:GNAT family N-acetyltransferase [Clostridia bacterium]